LVDN
jgi:hypothetical protein